MLIIGLRLYETVVVWDRRTGLEIARVEVERLPSALPNQDRNVRLGFTAGPDVGIDRLRIFLAKKRELFLSAGRTAEPAPAKGAT